MVAAEPVTATVVRVTKPDTLLIRAMVPHIQSMVSMHGVLMGTQDHTDGCKQGICDWVELHADAGRLGLLTCDWLRDSYGRLLIDLTDLQSGESLVDYLIDNDYCRLNDNHVIDCIREMLMSQEPEEDE